MYMKNEVRNPVYIKLVIAIAFIQLLALEAILPPAFGQEPSAILATVNTQT